jgi:uncharacterized protein YprB with RNaseH-like and TPR domain
MIMDKKTEDKLNSLGLHFGTNHLKINLNQGKSEFSVTNGTISENSLGSFYYLDTKFDRNYRHGQIEFSNLITYSENKRFPGMDSSFNINECIFIDTETTGLSQSAGTFAFMVGVGIIKEDSLLIRQYFLRNPGEEAAMLLDLSNFIENYKVLVSYNGISFDIPILINRYILYRMPHDLRTKKQLDLLKYSRSIWRYQFEDRSLKSIESKVLSYQRTSEEVPGWMAPEIYRDFLKTGNYSQIQGVFYHNAMDVVSLAALVIKIDHVLSTSSDYEEQYDTLNFALAKLYDKNNERNIAVEIYEKAIIQNNIPHEIKIKAILSLSKIYKRENKYSEAVSLWEKAVEMENIDSMVELAKHYEHRERNISKAIYYTNLSKQTLDKQEPDIKIQSINKDLHHRLQRLYNKLESI